MQPARGRQLAAVLLVAYGGFLFLTNSRVTVFEDEASMIWLARKSVADLISPSLSGQGWFHHPPLSEMALHFWLRLTHDSFALLRAPSILFYCAALWIVAETAHLLWDARWTALLLGITWPEGYLLGRAAGWYALSMLGMAGLAWCYFLWRRSGRVLHLAAMAAWAVLLVYTNHFGWVFLAALGLDLLLARPAPRRLAQFLGAVGAVVLAFLPLVPELLAKTRAEIRFSGAVVAAALRSAYLAHSVFASEMAAPWTWPGAIAALSAAAILWIGLRHPESRRALLWLAAPLGVGIATGVLSSPRLILFGPWLVLFLTGVAAPLGRGRPPGRPLLAFLGGIKAGQRAGCGPGGPPHQKAKWPLALGLPHPRRWFFAGLCFGMGWLGIATGRYAGTHRYTEPWNEAAERVVEISRTGDVVLCSHPSFYFYLSYLLPWKADRLVPWDPVFAGGRTFLSVYGWRRASLAPGARLIYVRTALMPWGAHVENEVLQYASQNLRRVGEYQFDRDPSAALKNRRFPDVPQPEWRIRIEVWTR